MRPREGAHPSPALRVPSLSVPGLCRVVDPRSGLQDHCCSQAPPVQTARSIPTLGRRRQGSGNKGWGALLPPAAGRPSRPPSGTRTPASGRASLATQSRGSGGPFHPGWGWRTRTPGGRERRAGAAVIPALPLTPRRAGRSAPASLPASTCAQCARHALGDDEKFLLTLQPQVSAPRALLEPPAATASCEPLRQALTVKKTEQSCSQGAMAVRSPSPTQLCSPAACLWPAPSGRWRRLRRRRRRRPRSWPHYRACAAGPRPAPSLGAPPPTPTLALWPRPSSPALRLGPALPAQPSVLAPPRPVVFPHLWPHPESPLRGWDLQVFSRYLTGLFFNPKDLSK